MRYLRTSRIVAVGALLLPYAAAVAQGIKEVLHGQGPAVTLLAKELPDDYRAVRITVNPSQTDLLSAYGPLLTMGDANGRSAGAMSQIIALAGESWTNGQIITMEGDRFLVTYELNLDQVTALTRSSYWTFSPQSYSAEDPAMMPAKPSAPKPLTFNLKLIKVSSISSLAPDPNWTKADIVKLLDPNGGLAQASEENKQKLTNSNMKQVALATVLYTSDYDDVFPYAQNTHTVQTVTSPYVKGTSVWKTANPNGGEILFNMAIGGVETSSIPTPAQVVMYYESAAWPDGRRSVAFADGHVKLVDEAEWQGLKVTLSKKYKRKATKPLPIQ